MYTLKGHKVGRLRNKAFDDRCQFGKSMGVSSGFEFCLIRGDQSMGCGGQNIQVYGRKTWKARCAICSVVERTM